MKYITITREAWEEEVTTTLDRLKKLEKKINNTFNQTWEGKRIEVNTDFLDELFTEVNCLDFYLGELLGQYK